MDWKNILKNYKPMMHAVQGQRNLGREMKNPTPENRRKDFDVSRLAYILKPIAQENPQILSETNPDGSPRTLKDVAKDANSKDMTTALANLGNALYGNMTVKEYKKLTGLDM